jgi:hypothetical protein
MTFDKGWHDDLSTQKKWLSLLGLINTMSTDIKS